MATFGLYLIACGLLVAAGTAKAARPGDTARSIHEMFPRIGVPRLALALRAVAAVEALVGIAGILVPDAPVAAVVFTSYLAFAIFVVHARRQGGSLATCGCFGAADTPPTLAHAVVDAVLAVGALGFGIAGRTGRLDLVLGHQVDSGMPLVAAALVGGWLAFLVMAPLARLQGLRRAEVFVPGGSVMTLIERTSRFLEGRLSRRSFVVRSAFAGSALSVGGVGFLLRSGTAYAAVCSCGNPDCGCDTTCCAGYTEFCCVIDGGYNYCPSDTIMGGWWMAEGSEYCSGPRYYMDCNATCKCDTGCGDGYQFCSTECDGTSCGCAEGSCDNYLTGCFQFRYGQCNQDVGCIGRIVCRVVTCVPPWEIDPTCTMASATDDGTANQTAACVTPGPTPPPPPIHKEVPVPATIVYLGQYHTFDVSESGDLVHRHYNPADTAAGWGKETLATGCDPARGRR